MANPRGVCSVDDDVVFWLEFEMGNIEVADCVERRGDGALALGTRARGAQLALNLPQRAQHAGTVEALSFTVFAEAHSGIVTGGEFKQPAVRVEP